MVVGPGVVQNHMDYGKLVEQDVGAYVEGKKVVFVGEGEGGEVDEDRAEVVASDEDRETVEETDEGAEKEDHEQMVEIADAEDENLRTVAAVAY